MKIYFLAVWLFYSSVAFAVNANIGIGTTIPAAKLDVEGTGGVALNAGNVGIGTTSPITLLQVKASTTASEVSISNPSYTGYLTTSASGNALIMGGGSYYNGSNFVATSTTSSYLGAGEVGISFYADSALTPGSTYTPTTRMVILANGNIGVGTSAPGTTLDVNGGIRAGASTVVTVTCNSTNEGVQRYNYTSHTMEYCNGSAWTALGLSTHGSQAITTSSNFTVPAGVTQIFVQAWGGGGGGTAGAGPGAGTFGQTSSGNTSFGPLTANGGGAAPANSGAVTGGSGGSATGGTINIAGSPGGIAGGAAMISTGGMGGSAPGGGGSGGSPGQGYQVGDGASGNFPGGGGGGAGAGNYGSSYAGAGGGSGAYSAGYITVTPGQVIAATIGGGGNGGSANAGNNGGNAGGNGAAGLVIVYW